MSTTPVSLLDRLRVAPSDSTDWHRLHNLYFPLIRSWLVRIPGVGHDVEDIVQEVLVVLFRELPSFERRRDGAFRSWLRQITLNRIRAFQKARRKRPIAGEACDELLAQLEDPASDLSRQWERDHDMHVSQKLLALVKDDFEPATWQAFVHFALEGHTAAYVARAMGISERDVIQAKYRIMKRLRAEAGDLID